jgi:hypothetical protein
VVQIQDATEALAKALAKGGRDKDEIDSIHQARIDPEDLPAIIAEPESVVKALGLPISAESQVHVTMKRRAARAAQTFRRRVIIIVIHWRNCDTDIWIILF